MQELLVCITVPKIVGEFAYDALGRRVEKKDLIDPNNTTRYYYNNNWQVLCEYNGLGTFQRLFIYGNYIDEVLLMFSNYTLYYYVHDHLYSPVALHKADGTVQERYEYDAYGNCTVLEPNFADDPDGKSDFGNPCLFTGRRVDILDNGSLKIQYNRNRYYDYYTGRWLTHDPLRMDPATGALGRFMVLDQYDDGLSLYEYVHSGPSNGIDPMGLWLPPAPPGTGPPGWCPGLKGKAINALMALNAKYAPHEYYWITGIPVTMSKLLSALNWLAASDYYDSEKPWYYPPSKNMYLDADMGTDAHAAPTVFHEAIHAYNHMTFGVFGISNRADEGMAYAAERMLWTLDRLWFLERELNKLAPSRKLLRRRWREAWGETSGANGVIGYMGYYEVPWTGLTHFYVSVVDVALVEKFLGFELPCAHLAKVYNLIIQKKGIKCMRFSCETKEECEGDITLEEELLWIFK